MLKIFTQSLKNGTHQIDVFDDVKNLNWDNSEFFGEVKVVGKLSKVDSRMTLKAKAICNSKLICDWSLEEFEHLVEVDFEMEIIESTILVKEKETELDDEKFLISKEDKYLDITERVYEELVLSLPMKRVSPKFDGMSFEEVFEKYSAKAIINVEEDGSSSKQLWTALKNVNLN